MPTHSIATLVLALSTQQTAELRLPSIFSDHMVLQREHDAPIWGWTEPGGTVTIEADWLDAPLTTNADPRGRFRTSLRTPAAGGPHRIRLKSSGGAERTLEDVLCGEVWLASGQSNMEWPLRLSEGGEEEIARAAQPLIRVFDAANTFAMSPREDVSGSWQLATPGSLREFSAVAWFFGCELERALSVPVGLIGSNWGGTPAEAWTSEPSLRRLSDFDLVLNRMVEEARDPERYAERQRQAIATWWTRLAVRDDGERLRWFDGGLDDSAWEERQEPVRWSSAGWDRFDGIAWMRKRVSIPAAWAGQSLRLELGPIDDMDSVWFAGQKIGGIEEMGGWSTPRVYEVPAELAQAGEACLAVRVIDTGGEGGLTGEGLRIRPVAAGEAEAISLAGSWRVKKSVGAADLGPFPSGSWFHQNQPAALHQGMIAPLAPYALAGAIWYQGESNVGRAEQYERLFPLMILDWRQSFASPELPFYYVQIAPFAYGNDTGQAGALRDAQRRALATPHTGMVVTLDIGDPQDIHPRNKREVGRRLALLALARTYGREGIEDSGPLYRGHSLEGRRIRVELDHAAGLVARGGAPTTFELAGADGRWKPAEATIDGSAVLVESAEVAEPVRVRYAWGAAAEPNLFNGAGLPASTFVTD